MGKKNTTFTSTYGEDEKGFSFRINISLKFNINFFIFQVVEWRWRKLRSYFQTTFLASIPGIKYRLYQTIASSCCKVYVSWLTFKNEIY
jgi:hypothetical protein